MVIRQVNDLFVMFVTFDVTPCLGVVNAIFAVIDQLNLDLDALGIELPVILADGSFGVFKGRNNSRETYTVGTGISNNLDYAVVKTYQV